MTVPHPLSEYDVVFMSSASGGGGDGDGAAVAGRHTVDFEGLAFAQGGHLNTNKNTNLPPGSTRTTDKVPDEATLVFLATRRLRWFPGPTASCP